MGIRTEKLEEDYTSDDEKLKDGDGEYAYNKDSLKNKMNRHSTKRVPSQLPDIPKNTDLS